MAEPVRIEPWDEANQSLVRSVHPPDWVNPMPRGRYDLAVVGAGTAGLVSAVVAAGLGARVALIEQNLMGGDCLNVGCVPSKTLIRAARAASEARAAARFGVRVPDGVRVDFARVMQRVREVRAALAPHDSAARYRELGVDVYFGRARFAARAALEVAGTELRFARAVIATGARAAVPAIPGLAELRCLTNENLFELTELPARLAVLGAGPIGCEMAQAFARLGSEVTLLEMADRVLPRDDPEASELLEAALARDGVRVLTGARVERAEPEADGGARILFSRAGAVERVDVDRLLLGLGRTPNVEDLGLDAAGVACDANGVRVDDRLRTTNRRIFAAGDVCLSLRFTHSADAAAKLVVQNALFLGRKKFSDLVVPWCTYTDPEVAHVGVGPSEARARGVEIDTYRVPLSSNDRARTDGDPDGFVKLHTLRRRDRIVGATIVARHAGEMIGPVALAIAQRIGLARFAGVILPYPTRTEAIKAVSSAYLRTRLTPVAQRILAAWLRLRSR
jgi:pyruvate/2-oxoglutarate dehydrogenase complex dihydrolipoamide dehydrogenase (E3) component